MQSALCHSSSVQHKKLGHWAFSYAGPYVWNSLPEHLWQTTLIDLFNALWKRFYSGRYRALEKFCFMGYRSLLYLLTYLLMWSVFGILCTKIMHIGCVFDWIIQFQNLICGRFLKHGVLEMMDLDLTTRVWLRVWDRCQLVSCSRRVVFGPLNRIVCGTEQRLCLHFWVNPSTEST